jgi:tetratricopeptide (TPR) repeat protein
MQISFAFRETALILTALFPIPYQTTLFASDSGSQATGAHVGGGLQQAASLTSVEERADVLMARQEYQAAISAYDLIPEKSAAIWNKTGIAYQHMCAFKEAKADYERALKLRRSYADALNNLGTIFLEQKDFHAAEKLFKKAIRSDPNKASFSKNLGTTYFAEGKIQQGAVAYRAAFSLDPDIFERMSTQSIEEPSSTVERAGLYYCMAELFARAGLKDRAIDFLRKSLSEGFNDRKRLLEDNDFAQLRATPAFSQLMREHGIR